jgi:DNA modification methylase
MWPIDRPIPYARNPRKNADAVPKVAGSLKEYGWKQPLVVDAEGVIVAGDTRLKAARSLGMAFVPVVVARDLTAEQVKAYRLADNRTGEEAEWDSTLLSLEIEDLRLASYSLALTGFDAAELKVLAAIQNATPLGFTEPDEAPALDRDKPTVSVLGDVWILGGHRLICGDATLVDVVKKLLGEELVDLVLTDPPYNVDYVGKTADALRIQNDAMAAGDFLQFLSDAFGNAALHAGKGAGIYVFHADTEGLNFRTALAAGGWHLSQCCVWVKQSMVMGRQDYHWQHEPVLFAHLPFEPEHDPILYGWKLGAAHRWYADRRQTTVWEFDRPSRSVEHPTMKPVDMLEYAMTNSSQPGDLVLDMFAGSGSTLIAAEKIGRAARLVELDPKYCDVIVRRWQQFTGKAAVNAEGRTFDQVGAAALAPAAAA